MYKNVRYSKFYNGILFHIIKGSPKNEVVLNEDQLTVVVAAEKKHHSKWLILYGKFISGLTDFEVNQCMLEH